MSQYIVKFADGGRDYYLLWSSNVDAPVTYGMSLDELREHIKEEEGLVGLRALPARLARVEAKGTSSMLHASAQETVACNRAGAGETELTVEQIVDHYCRKRPGEDEPEPELPAGRPW